MTFTQTIVFTILPFATLEKADQDLLKSASKVRSNAQAPYSEYYVGSAIETKEGAVFCGCNVERCSYSQATHAEQNAIDSMVAQLGSAKIQKVAVVAAPAGQQICFETTGKEPAFEAFATPCGHCRQIIWENAHNDKTVKIMSLSSNGYVLVTSIGDLFPLGFGPAQLGIEY
jgi:cytidine deaminase